MVGDGFVVGVCVEVGKIVSFSVSVSRYSMVCLKWVGLMCVFVGCFVFIMGGVVFKLEEIIVG